MSLTLIVVLVVLAVVVLGGIGIYNRLIALRARTNGAWSDIDVQLKRRHDLVDNLVVTVKGYAAHERATLERVVEARNEAVRATGGSVGGAGGGAGSGTGGGTGGGAGRGGPDPGAAGAAETFLSQQLRQLFALAEAYPDLKASSSFQELQTALTQLEDAIQNARRYYNAVVRDFNTQIRVFPNVLLSGVLGFRERKFFELSDPGEAQAPEVRFQP